MATREKARVKHVRTGCMTCKRRRVKCSEERPHCSRCIRGGFVCAGYAVPKAWIFTGSNEAPATFSETERPQSSDKGFALTPSQSLLRLGNSDPFDSQSIPIGPHESDLLKVYREFSAQRLGGCSWWKVDRVEVVQMMCLPDKAATLALLARNLAIQEFRSRRGQSTEISTTNLSYLAGAQAALRKNLGYMSGSGPRTPSIIIQILWTTCLLAYAELINGSPTVGLHLRAMSQILVRYAELTGSHVDRAHVIGVSIIDVVRACTTLTRPTIDMVNWFPAIFRTMWEETGVVCHNVQGDKKSVASSIVHRAIKDKRLRTIVLVQRQEQEKHHELVEANLDAKEASVRGQSIHSRQLFQQAQLLHIVLDAIERLGTPRISQEQVQDQTTRAYLSISVLLWLLITSPVSFTPERLLDGIGRILQHARNILMKGGNDARVFPSDPRFQEARLWALCIGVHTELHRKENLGHEPACATWFFEAFAVGVKSMKIRSWQQMTEISEHFLPLDRMQPHISRWWQQVVTDYSVKRQV